MKAVDAWITAAGVVALGLAALVVLRARESATSADRSAPPPAHAPLPPDGDFPACMAQPPGKDRWQCQVAQARRQSRLRCIGQRLYYVADDPAKSPRYFMWPPSLTCWTSADANRR